MYLPAQPNRYAVPASRRYRQIGAYPYRRRRLGALTPDQAAQTAMPTNTVRSTAGFTQAVYNEIVQSAAAGQVVATNPSTCQGSASLKPAILSVGSGIALKLAPLAGPAAPLVALGAAAAGLFAVIFGSHAAKVAKENQVLCASVPAANDSLLAIDQAVQNGTLSPSQGQAALTQLLAEFSQNVASIIKMSPSQCNAACVWTKQLQAVVAQKSSVYADLLAAQSAAAAASSTPAPAGSSAAIPPGSIAPALAPVTNVVDQISAQIGLPSVAVYGLAALLVWRLL